MPAQAQAIPEAVLEVVEPEARAVWSVTHPNWAGAEAG